VGALSVNCLFGFIPLPDIPLPIIPLRHSVFSNPSSLWLRVAALESSVPTIPCVDHQCFIKIQMRLPCAIYLEI
jgi:hypothetical protein